MRDVDGPLAAMGDRALTWVADAATRPDGPRTKAPVLWDWLADTVGREQVRRSGGAVPAQAGFSLPELPRGELLGGAETLAMMLNAVLVMPTRVELTAEDEAARLECVALYELLAEALVGYIELTAVVSH